MSEISAFCEWIPINHPKSSERDRAKKAFQYAFRAHFGQLRRTLRPFIYHPTEMAKKARELDLPLEYEEACFLHDTTEDCLQTFLEIYSMFGPTVSLLVFFMDKKKLCCFESYRDKSNVFYELDPRTIILRLIDSWSNLREPSGYKNVLSRKRAAWDALDLLETARGLFPNHQKYSKFFQEIEEEAKKYA